MLNNQRRDTITVIYKTIVRLEPGMIIDKTILDSNGKVLLQKGVELKKGYIQKLQDYNIKGVYIREDLPSGKMSISYIEQANLDNSFTKKAIIDMIHTREDIEGLLSGSNYASLEIEIRSVYGNLGVAEKKNDVELDGVLHIVKTLTQKFTPYGGKVPNLLNLDLESTLSLMGNVDDYLYRHSVNVAVLSLLIGLELNLSESDLEKLTIGALLHDVGKLFVKQSLINKRGILTESEFKEVKEHSLRGYRYVRDIYSIPVKSYVGILQHHERYDGLGYPNRVKGKDIFLFGRIIAIADVYDAITSDRPQRKAMPPAEAMEYIMGGAGTLFDYDLVSIFVDKIAPYPLGSIVMLSNGFEAVVIGNNNGLGCRPKVEILSNCKNEGKIIDLSNKVNINVVITEKG